MSATKLKPVRGGVGAPGGAEQDSESSAIYELDALEVDLSDAVLAKLKKDEAKYPADRFRGRAP